MPTTSQTYDITDITSDGDLDKALELMPRRVVAERCILESYKKQGGDTRNAMGALSTVKHSYFR